MKIIIIVVVFVVVVVVVVVVFVVVVVVVAVAVVIVIVIIIIIIISSLPKGMSLASKFSNRLCFQLFSSLLHTTPQPNHLLFPFLVLISSSCLPVFPLV